MRKFLFLLSFAICLACGEKEAEIEDSSDDFALLSDSLEVQTNRRVTLQPEAQEQVRGWLAFATAYNEVEDMRTATGRQLVEKSQPLVQIMEALENTLPDSLQRVPVRARTAVLVTKANILHQAATKKERDAEEIFGAANDIIVEFDNFKLQLNELFLKTPQDFEVELDRQFQESQDSINEAREAVLRERGEN